jgi:hypothetical protein
MTADEVTEKWTKLAKGEVSSFVQTLIEKFQKCYDKNTYKKHARTLTGTFRTMANAVVQVCVMEPLTERFGAEQKTNPHMTRRRAK